MSEVTPRISAPFLESFVQKTVRVLGKVININGDQVTIDASGQVVIHLTRGSHVIMNNAVEVVGKVQNDLSIKALVVTDFGSDIDFTAAEAVVDVTHRYKEIFYGDD